jgi:ribosome modulation factor
MFNKLIHSIVKDTNSSSDKAYSEGYWAHQRGACVSDNPYTPSTEEYNEWLDGWHCANNIYGSK